MEGCRTKTFVVWNSSPLSTTAQIALATAAGSQYKRYFIATNCIMWYLPGDSQQCVCGKGDVCVCVCVGGALLGDCQRFCENGNERVPPFWCALF